MPTNGVSYSVNIDSPIAVYVQIENQVRFAIAAGKLNPGDTLPSVREMSETLKINPNTVTKAYRDLELMQLVHTRRGVGVTVSEKAPKLCRDSAREMARNHLIDAVAECTSSGIPAAEVRKLVSKAIDDGVLPYRS